MNFAIQLVGHTAMLGLVLVLAPSSWMKFSAAPMRVSYWSALANQFSLMTVFTLLMLVLGVKVSPRIDVKRQELHRVV